MYTKKAQDHIPYSFSYKLACNDDKFSKAVVLYRSENAVYKFIESILEEYEFCKRVMKENINKNLSMSVEMKKNFSQVIDVGYVTNCLM